VKEHSDPFDVSRYGLQILIVEIIEFPPDNEQCLQFGKTTS